MNDSTFSGVKSFCRIAAAYRVLAGSRTSDLDWPFLDPVKIRALFPSRLERFERGQPFVERCRLLLDLFKLQIVYAAEFYE